MSKIDAVFVEEFLPTAAVQLEKDNSTVATRLNELVRDTENVQAALWGYLRRKYDSCEPADDKDVETMSFKIEDLIEKSRSLVAGESVGVSHKKYPKRGFVDPTKLAKVDAILSSCRQLLAIDGEVATFRRSSRADRFLEATDSYKRFQDLGNALYDSYTDGPPQDMTVVMAAVTRAVNVRAAILLTELKKIFCVNVSWSKTVKESRLTLQCPTAENKKSWMEVLLSLEKLDALEPLLDRFFSDLMAHFVRPMMELPPDSLGVFPSCDFVLKCQTSLATEEKVPAVPAKDDLWKKFCLFCSLLDFLQDKLRGSLTDDGAFSLAERLGSRGRGRKLFRYVVGRVTSSGVAADAPCDARRCLEGIKMVVNSNHQLKFIKADELEELVAEIDGLLTRPSVYSSVLSRALSLVKENLHFVVPSGVSSGPDADESFLSGRTEASAACEAMPSPYWMLFESLEKCLPDELKFPDCCLSIPGRKLVDLLYDALEARSPSLDGNTTAADAALGGSFYDVTKSFSAARPKAGVRTLRVMNKSSPEEVASTFKCVRQVAELFLESVPVLHDKDIKENPLIAAVHHNDCLYLAHHLMLLESHVRPPKLVIRSRKNSANTTRQPAYVEPPTLPLGTGFVDLQFALKKCGVKSLAGFLGRKRKEFSDLLAKNFGLEENGEVSTCRDVANSLRSIEDQLSYLKKIWTSVLPAATLNKALGSLVDKVIESTVEQCIFGRGHNKPAAAAEARGQKKGVPPSLLILARLHFTFIGERIVPSLFPMPSKRGALTEDLEKTEVLLKNIPKWGKLREIHFVLEPLLSSKRVLARWGAKDPKSGTFSCNPAVIGNVLPASEARAFALLAFQGRELQDVLELIN